MGEFLFSWKMHLVLHGADIYHTRMFTEQNENNLAHLS